MNEQYNVVLARHADTRQIATMSRDLIEQGLVWSWTASRVRRAIGNPECNVVVARCESRVIGFGIMEYGFEKAHLVLFAVRHKARRAQVGTQLLTWLEETAKVAGLERIELETRQDNVSARRFYYARGYRETGLVPGYYAGRENAVRMTRKLHANYKKEHYER